VTTLVLPAEETQKSLTRGKERDLSVWSRIGLAVLLMATAALYLWNLSASGWANAFYSAAAQAGAGDWTAMLFGSSDAANAITVDKTPAALWIIDVSVRLFGLNPWSILVPQALEGRWGGGVAVRRGPPGGW
jgi:4-amino-4-deoxy-L-arabinose transferase-like glycosyltransferase